MQKKLVGAHPTHPPPHPSFFFGNPSLTWTEHSNHNSHTFLAMLYRQNTHGVLLKNISTGLGLFWDDLKKNIPSETWTHPPTSTVILDFWNFFFLQSPLLMVFCHSERTICPVITTHIHTGLCSIHHSPIFHN